MNCLGIDHHRQYLPIMLMDHEGGMVRAGHQTITILASILHHSTTITIPGKSERGEEERRG